ncbi:MAG: SusC/RagA family TonB-linked outer membrane protein [Chitinophagaceae bacterium]
MPFVFLSVLILSFSVSGWAQNKVSGRITDDNGAGISGASVVVKGTTTGVTTDNNGYFSIDATRGATLVFSSISYTQQEIKVGSSATMDVKLASATGSLGEVIVVGYGTQRKKDITGSVVSVGEKTLDEVPAANLTMALQGRAAGVDIARTGVRPGSSGQIRIRGNRSLTAGNEALIVVDGFPYFGSINDLNIDDIANIDILKDASATAIYGSRGSNGVIIITTKKGRVGKPVISYSTSTGWSEVINKFPLFEAEDYYNFKSESRYGAPNATAPAVFTPAELEGKAAGTNTDWQDYLYKKGFLTSHDLSLSGGTDVTSYGIGASYLQQEGIIPLVGFKRFSLRATIEQKIGKRIRIGLNTMNTVSYTDGDGVNPVYNTLALSPLLSPYNPDGSINVQPLVGHQDVGFRLNPLTLTKENAVLDRRRRLRTYNTLYGELEILKGLKYRINVLLDMRQDNYNQYFGANTVITGSSSTPFLSNTVLTQNGEAWNYGIFHQLTYDKVISEKHRFNFTAVYEIGENESKTSTFSGTGIPADYIQNTNFSTLVSQISANTNTGANSYAKQGLLSYMARLNYTFNDRYNLTATLRRDGSSVLSEGKWTNYPALAASWNAHEESFLQNISWLSTLKLRLGWGRSAQQGIPPYSTLGNLAGNNYNFGATTTTGYYVSVLPNVNLGWESTSVTNLGLDFGLFKNRITASVDVYTADTKDILVRKLLPLSNGADAVFTNAAKTKSKGVEIVLSSVNIDMKSGFKWTTDINWSLNREEIVELEDPNRKQDIQNGWFVGQPFTVIYDFKKIGIWQTKDAAEIALYGAPQAAGRIRVEDKNNDKKINADDMQVLGSAQPDWIGGITNRFTYKNIDLSVVAFARWGGTAIATYFQSNNGGGGGYGFFNQARVNQWKVDYWTTSNPTNAFPHPEGAALNDNYASTLGYFDATFVRVRSINLGYTLPSRLLSKAGISSARVFASVTNPFIVHAPIVRDGFAIDPEGTGTGGVTLAAQGGSTANPPAPSRAIVLGINTPSTREFTFGINLKL